LEKDDIRACLVYAAHVMDTKEEEAIHGMINLSS